MAQTSIYTRSKTVLLADEDTAAGEVPPSSSVDGFVMSHDEGREFKLRTYFVYDGATACEVRFYTRTRDGEQWFPGVGTVDGIALDPTTFPDGEQRDFSFDSYTEILPVLVSITGGSVEISAEVIDL